MRNVGGSSGLRDSNSKHHQGSRRLFRRGPTTPVEKRFDIETVGVFKMAPSFRRDHFDTNRPLMGYCSNTIGLDKFRSNEFVNPELKVLKQMGIRNILDVRTEVANAGFLAKLFPAEVYSLQRPLFKKYSDISSAVLTSPRVLSAIEQASAQLISSSHSLDNEDHAKLTICAVEKKCVEIVEKMKASVSSAFIKASAWFLTKFFPIFLNSIHVCRGQLMMVKQINEKGIPMIYLPLHQSHLDYILVTLILWHYDIRAPYVAAGDNIDIPFFNRVLRALGGFYIRRKLDKGNGEKDFLYRAILHEYMSQLLVRGEGLEFFIEGGRTRTGRSINPKGGLLSVVVEACLDGDIPDAYITPVAFSYEKIIDGHYTREQMGLPKVRETFWGTVKAIFRVIFNNYGSVRVDFARPFSLREFLEHNKKCPYLPLTSDNVRELGAKQCTSYPNFSEAEMSSKRNGESARMTVKALADYTVYISDHCKPPMVTHLLAFLLLTKYRHGVYMRELSKAVSCIVRELQAIQVDVGFCGQSEDAIHYAWNLLGERLISRLWQAENNDFKFFPNLSLPSVFELSYYGNQMSAHFAMESIFAAAVVYESKISIYHLLGSNPMPETDIVKERVLETAEKICMIVHNDFILIPPFVNVDTVLAEMLESFISKEIISVEDAQGDELMFDGKDRRWASQLAKSLDVDEEDISEGYVAQQSLKVNFDRSDVRERLHFLISVVGPVLESHLLVGKYVLGELLQEQVEQDFLAGVGQYARERVEKDMLVFVESCAMLNLRSAVKSLQDLEILYSYQGGNLTLLGLNAQDDTRSMLEDFVSTLQLTLS